MIYLILESADFEIDREKLWYKASSGTGEDLTETDLHYIMFMSRITFQVGDTVVIGPQRKVPLFDFLACVAAVLKDLRNGLSASIGFTEAADRVIFYHSDGDVLISAEEETPVRADRQDLIDTLATFLSSTRAILLERVPGLNRNPHIAKIYV